MRFLIASLLCLGACVSSGAHFGEEERAVSILTVKNQRPEILTIYVMRDGYKGRKLGEVNSLATATFVLTELDAPPATDLQFFAVAFKGSGSEISDPVQVVRGSSYEWKIAPPRGQQIVQRLRA